MTDLALHITSLRFTYPARRAQAAHEALRGVELSVPAGQSVAILGPNGSGKSTLLKIICGLLPATQGAVTVFGLTDFHTIRAHIGVVFQSPALDRHATVRENLRDQAILHGCAAPGTATMIDSALDRAGLSDRRDALVKTLSQGLARRVDLVRALLHRPRLLMLDEPTVGLDPSARERFLEQLQQRRQEQELTTLFSTHLIDEADRHDRVILMHEGQIVADGTPAQLRQSAGVRRIVVHDAQWTPPTDQHTMWHRPRSGHGWYMMLNENGARARTMAAELGESGVSFTIAPPTLADVFEQLTGASLDQTPTNQPAARRRAHS